MQSALSQKKIYYLFIYFIYSKICTSGGGGSGVDGGGLVFSLLFGLVSYIWVFGFVLVSFLVSFVS